MSTEDVSTRLCQASVPFDLAHRKRLGSYHIVRLTSLISFLNLLSSSMLLGLERSLGSILSLEKSSSASQSLRISASTTSISVLHTASISVLEHLSHR